MRAILCNSYVLVTIAIAACGAPKRDPSTDVDSGGGDGNSNSDNCSEEAKLVYTVDQDDTLSTFNPVTKQFVDLGKLSCLAQQLATPFSMGIDRNAGAYVLYSSSELFKVDTQTLGCTKTNWTAPSGFTQFGMGFSTDAVGGTTDTLFIAGGSGPSQPTSALKRMDTTTLTTMPVGTVSGWPELTGTGNAELWGFFPSTNGSTPRIEKLDKASGSAIQRFSLSTLAGNPQAWAFAFYGGDFFVFLQRGGESSTTVYQVDGMTGAISGMTPTNARRIVGAGVSTCAPVVIF